MSRLVAKAKDQPDAADARRIAELERQLERAKGEIKHAKDQRAIAVEDWQAAERRADIRESTRGKFETTKYRPPPRKPAGEATGIICATDWHIEERIDRPTVNGLNEYNLEIADARIRRLWEKSCYLLDHARGISDVRDVVLWLGGDFISGYIHEELQEANYLSPTQATFRAQSRIASGIEHILEHGGIKSVRVVCNYDNHSRTTIKKRVSTGHANSFAWLIYKNLEERYKDRGWKNVSFEISESYHALCQIQDRRFRFHHGDAIRYGGGVGGISIPVNKAIAQWNKAAPADFDIFGHWHQFKREWHWLACGSLIGHGPYSIAIKADYQPPTQGFVIADREHGVVFAEPVFVEAA